MYKKWLSELVIALGCFWSQTNLNGLGFHRMNFIDDLHLEEGSKCYDRSNYFVSYGKIRHFHWGIKYHLFWG
jgi:hypothetical protein